MSLEKNGHAVRDPRANIEQWMMQEQSAALDTPISISQFCSSLTPPNSSDLPWDPMAARCTAWSKLMGSFSESQADTSTIDEGKDLNHHEHHI